MKQRSAFLLALTLATASPAAADEPFFSPAEFAALRTLSITNLPPPPADPSNKYANDPRAADFGHRLFFDKRLSSSRKVACATCHRPELGFTDGKKLAQGVGVTDRNAPSVVGAAWNNWFFWDGRKDSMWSQALASFENPVEHNMPRAKIVEVIRKDQNYARRYRAIFGDLPARNDNEGVTRAFVNLAKSIAAYERYIAPGAERFDHYVAAKLEGREPAPDARLTLDEELGLRSFLRVQQSQCMRCHNGPLFTNGTFHNIGTQSRDQLDNEQGRFRGVEKAVADEFNCASQWSDAPREACVELSFARRGGKELLGAFKAPSLRNVTKTAPYMHNGKIASLEDVIWHYRTSRGGPVGQSALESATLTGTEFDQIRAFLATLESQPAAPAKYLRAPPRSIQ